ncbi:hypothetical protein HYFRA_00013779 [Hymenoscyphus fraxineus]|uniref:Uncharacterized protein n=1 Tax=Hymenoscyphus fraxineus TaxID=746836 RepID=A0A9N9LB81_9HELO|nr:hypothetical protein HYFRA_00013779 [Hymenoscyphus fraxineus]
MDFIKNATGGGSSTTNNQQQQPGAGGVQEQAQGQAQTDDYGDKGLAFAEKQSGHSLGRETNEKITDGARGLYEKATGNKVDAKFSN